MTDRIDDALKAIAQVEASPEFATRVAAQIDSADSRASAWWPRLATAGGLLVAVAIVIVWIARAPDEPQRTAVRPTIPSPAEVAPGRSAPERGAERLPAIVERRSAHRKAVPVEQRPDHERALNALAGPAVMAVAVLAPAPLDLPPLGIAHLDPIAGLSLGLDTADPGEGDRR